jgi:tetratricopeptide (TPR) repeat protein
MSRLEGIKRFGIAQMERRPVYKLIPAARYRDYAAIHYLNRAAPEQIAAYITNAGRTPDLRSSSLIAAAKASFALGQDELARQLASRASALNPALPGALLVLSDIARCGGDYAAAFQYAYDAWMLQPDAMPAATRTMSLGYGVKDVEHADKLVLTALARFARKTAVLWAACKQCQSNEQLDRIRDLHLAWVKKPSHISAGARPLALAALHLQRFDLALALYAEACAIELRGAGIGREIKEKQLAGKHGLSVLQDLRNVLEETDTPFFFAAGTALGIIRDGRPLDHDDDIDVGVFQEAWKRDQLVEAFRRHPRFTFEPTMTDTSKIRLIHRGRAGVDIFMFYREGEHVYHDGNFVRWRNTPFDIAQHQATDGSVVYLPSNVEGYLRENYGDWQTPDPTFDAFVDGPNAEVTSTAYFEVHRLRRAYKFIRARNLPAAFAEIACVRPALQKSREGRTLLAEVDLWTQSNAAGENHCPR